MEKHVKIPLMALRYEALTLLPDHNSSKKNLTQNQVMPAMIQIYSTHQNFSH